MVMVMARIPVTIIEGETAIDRSWSVAANHWAGWSRGIGGTAVIGLIAGAAEETSGDRSDRATDCSPFELAVIVLTDERSGAGTEHAADHRPALRMNRRIAVITRGAEQRTRAQQGKEEKRFHDFFEFDGSGADDLPQILTSQAAENSFPTRIFLPMF